VGWYPSCHPTNSVKALKANEKIEYNKSKHASTTKYTKHKNKHKKLKPFATTSLEMEWPILQK